MISREKERIARTGDTFVEQREKAAYASRPDRDVINISSNRKRFFDKGKSGQFQPIDQIRTKRVSLCMTHNAAE
jgi:hypothetical protein